MRKSKSGFTIIELLVVVVVIGILAGITLVAYNGTQARSRDARRKTDVANIIKAMELYYSDNGQYPVPTGATGLRPRIQPQLLSRRARGLRHMPGLRTARTRLA